MLPLGVDALKHLQEAKEAGSPGMVFSEVVLVLAGIVTFLNSSYILDL